MESDFETLEGTFEGKFYKKRYLDFSNVELINRVKMLEAILDSIEHPIFWKNEYFQIIGGNQAFKNFSNMSAEKYLGKTVDEVPMLKIHAENYKKDDRAVFCEGKTIKKTEEVFINKTDKRIIHIIKSPVRENGEIIAITVTFKDVTKQKKIENELFKASYTDVLTGLYNRAYFDKKILELDNESNYPLTVAMIDVNGLKIMNDTFGHVIGDLVLQKIAKVLKDNFFDEAIVARIGGDEFAIIFSNTLLSKVEQMCKVASLEIHNIKINNVKLSISYGCATKTNGTEDLSEIFVDADDLMYRRKRANYNVYRKNIVNTIMQNLYKLLPDETLHGKLVSKNCVAIAKKLNYSIEDIKKLSDFAGFHDIGKIGISKELLEKTEPLTKEDWAILRSHSEIGYAILNSSDEYREYANLVLTHHERYDGEGYPKGLKGDAIPEFSRLLCVADAIAAMEVNRTYRKALTKEQILFELKDNLGTQFDPRFGKVAIELIESGALDVTKYSSEKFDLKDFIELK